MFLKKKKYISSQSLSKLAWKKFKKNKIAISSFYFLIFLFIVAILGYIITPDKTPYSNNQCLEIAAKPPGFSVTMLLIRKDEALKKTNFFSTMLFGKENIFEPIPIYNYHFSGDTITYEEYTGLNPNKGELFSINIADAAYSFHINGGKPKISGNNISFTNFEGQRITENIGVLTNFIKDNLIVKKRFLLGTDRYGRDLLSQIIIGARVSLSVGFISVFISLILGILMGALAGFFRGWIDNIIIWFINVVWSIPTLLLVIAITFALGKGFWQVFVAVGLTMWVEVARVVRGQILSIREKDFIEAGRALGFKNFRIITRHILPNVMGAVIVISAANFASAILIEAGLSFLGIGVQPPMPSWGTMIKEHYAYIILDAPYLAILPGVAIMITVLAFMLAGNGLRDALDVKIQ